MSIIYKCNLGAFLNHDSPWERKSNKPNKKVLQRQEKEHNRAENVQSAHDNRRDVKTQGDLYRFKRDLFAVYSPFMMDSQADRMQREATVADSCGDVKETSAQRKRRKKSRNKSELSESEKKMCDTICKALIVLVEQARELSYLDKLLPPSSLLSNNTSSSLSEYTVNALSNNSAARAASQIVGCGNMFQALCCDFDESVTDHHDSSELVILRGENMSPYKASTLIGRHICNQDDLARIIKVDNHQFIIPPLSSFLTSSFDHFVTAGYKKVQVKDGYNLIVIDPPWNNKSVKRKKSYNMVHEMDLKQLPIRDLARNHSLVCVWITNNDRLKSFVTDELFPHWSVDLIAEWFWMKVTRYGESVCDILSPHKKPYEQLIIGRLKKPSLKVPKFEPCGVDGTGSASAISFICEDKTGSLNMPSSESKSCIEEVVSSIPSEFVLVSVPCALHSKKPSLTDILSQYLPMNPACLELFARNLTPGWVSWGNEPLLHQHVDYFEQTQ